MTFGNESWDFQSCSQVTCASNISFKVCIVRIFSHILHQLFIKNVKLNFQRLETVGVRMIEIEMPVSGQIPNKTLGLEIFIFIRWKLNYIGAVKRHVFLPRREVCFNNFRNTCIVFSSDSQIIFF